MRRLRNLAILFAAGLLAVACGSGSSTNKPSAAGGPSGVLTISNESGSLWTCGFNPFNLSVNFLDTGNVYEPLVFVNALKNQETTPWLASKWAWSNGNKTITFTIRPGVKWNDGQPMTAADVVYTFQLIKKNTALDLNSVWSVLSSVDPAGSDQVVMSFKTAAVPYFYYIADQTPIVPKHIWSTIANPVTFNDPHPVGTGAYMVNPCTPQNITFTPNKYYWQAGEPKIAKVLYPAFTSNDPANLYLANGQAQWGSQFIPNIDRFYASKSPANHYWFPPVAQVSLFINQKVAPLDNLAVRQALAYATDRQRASSIGEYGYEPPGNQRGVVTPTYSNWVDQSVADPYTFDPAKAAQVLTAAGFKKGGDGIFVSPQGKKLSFTVINIGGYSDWVAALQEVQNGMKQAGIQLTVSNLSSNDFDDKLFKGNFQLAYYGETGGPAPYYELRQWLYGPNSAPIGQTAATNFERYSNPTVDKLFDSYGATTDQAQQMQIVSQLEQVMVRDIPVIPVTEAVNWYQYNTLKFTGWVTQQDPYALPAAYQYPDMGQVLLHLQPK